MSSKLHYLKAAVVATVALSAAGAGVAGATGAIHGADHEAKPSSEVTLPATAAERAVAAISADHGKADEEHGKADDAAEAHDNHGAEVSTFARTTELEGREKGQAVAALASDGRSADDHGRADESHGQADESHGQADEDHGRSGESHGQSDDDHGEDAERRSDD